LEDEKKVYFKQSNKKNTNRNFKVVCK